MIAVGEYPWGSGSGSPRRCLTQRKRWPSCLSHGEKVQPVNQGASTQKPQSCTSAEAFGGSNLPVPGLFARGYSLGMGQNY